MPGRGGVTLRHDEFLKFPFPIRFRPFLSRWQIDGKTVHIVENDGRGPYPKKPVYVYISVWDAAHIADGAWAGKYNGKDEPFFT